MRDRFLWFGCLLYATLFTALGWVKYAAHRNLVDFGIFAQTAASAFNCFCNPIEGSHWAVHFSPILYPVGVALTLVRSPMTLIALAAIAGALVAPPIYEMVRARGEVRTARLAATVAWLYPPLAGLVFGDFHENVFAPAAVAWTLYAFDSGFMVWAIVGALVSLMVKEDQAIFLAVAGAMGAWYFRGTRRGRVAAIVALLSAVVFMAFFLHIQPHAAIAANKAWQPERFYAWTAADWHAVAAGVAARMGFLLLILAPLLFLPVRSRFFALAAAPLAEVLFSRMPTTFTLGTHYAGAWIGYVLAPFALAVGKMEPARANRMLAACIVLCVVEFAVADPLHPGMNVRHVQPRDSALDGFLRRLPPNADVATQEEAYTHLALIDPRAYLLPESAVSPIDACFVLVDRDFPDSARLQEYGETLGRLVREGQYVEVFRAARIELYRRASGCHYGTDASRSISIASTARTGQPASPHTIR